MTAYRPIPRSPRLRRDHPLARGLLSLVAPGRGLRDLARTATATLHGGLYAATPLGRAARVSGGGQESGAASDLTIPSLGVGFPAVTVAILLRRRSGTSSIAGAWDAPKSLLFRESEGHTDFFVRDAADAAEASVRLPTTLSTEYDLLMGVADGTYLHLYLRGERASVALAGPYLPSVTALSVGAPRRPGTTNTLVADVSLVACWARPVTWREYVAMAADPFGVIRPERTRLYTYAASAVVRRVRSYWS